MAVFSSRRRHTRSLCDWSSDVCSSDLGKRVAFAGAEIPPQLKQSYAEVENFLRLGKLDLLYCKVNEQKVEGDFKMLSADTTLTNFFDYRTEEGSLSQVLCQPGKVALSEACARRLFGGKQAVGKQVARR